MNTNRDDRSRNSGQGLAARVAAARGQLAVESRVLGERIWVIQHEALAASCPAGEVAYTLDEVELLRGESETQVRFCHLVKKMVGGRVVPDVDGTLGVLFDTRDVEGGR